MNVIIPMAGNSRRFKAAGHTKPKFLLKCGRWLMIEHVIDMFSEFDHFHLILNKDHIDEENITTTLKNLAPKVDLYFINNHEKGPTVSILNAKLNLDPSLPVIISYCDFTIDWDYELFMRSIFHCDAAVPYFQGFQAASLGNTNYAYMRQSNNTMLELREKKPFTSNRIDEPASTGIYYFKSLHYFEEMSQRLFFNQEEFPNNEAYVSLLLNEVVDSGGEVLLYKVNKFICFGTPEDLDQYNYWYHHFVNNNKKDMDKFVDVSMVPMAGEGKRFKDYGYRTSKPVIQIGNESLIKKCISSLPQSSREIYLMQKKTFMYETIRKEIAAINDKSETEFISVEGITAGPVSTCLLAREILDPKESLMISSCDYELGYDSTELFKLKRELDPDVIIFTFKIKSQPVGAYENFAYCQEDEGTVLKIIEKECISSDPSNDHMVTGTFWYKHASLFLEAADNLISNNIRVNNEYYIGTSINYLIEKNIKVICFEVDKWISFGDPKELNLYYFWMDYFQKNLNL